MSGFPASCERNGAQFGIVDKIFRISRYNSFGPLAHLVEQLTLNQWVAGSSPAWPIGFGGFPAGG